MIHGGISCKPLLLGAVIHKAPDDRKSPRKPPLCITAIFMEIQIFVDKHPAHGRGLGKLPKEYPP